MANKFLLKRGSGAPSSIDEYELVYDYTNNLLYTKVGATITAISGSGGSSDISVANQANNRLITATGTTDSLNGESNLTFDGNDLSMSPDTDNHANIGRAKVGSMGHSDWAGFSHYDTGSTTNFSVLQNSSGRTILNSASGQELQFRVNNADATQMVFDGTNLKLKPTSKLYLDGTAGQTYITESQNDVMDFYVGSVQMLRMEESGTDYVTVPDNIRLSVGTGKDLQIYHNETNSFGADNYTGHLIFQQRADDQDIIFKNDDGIGGVTAYLTLDGSAGYTTVQKLIKFEDSVDARFGTGSDLRIRHDGTNSKIDNYTGNLKIRNTLDDADITLETDNGSGGVTPYLTLDGSATNVIIHKQFCFQDTTAVINRVSNDLEIRTYGGYDINLMAAGNVGIGTTSPGSTLHISKETSTSASSTGTTLFTLTNDVGADLNQQKTFVDFTLLDDNANETPQVRIGAEVGQNGDANTQEKEGSGAFVVYTNNADTTSGDAGASLAERMRVDYQGNVGIGTTSPVTKLHIQDNYDPDDSLGYLHIENTNTTSGSVATNSALTVKNYHGTSQFMQWEEHGLRIGSRILTNSGSGHLVFTAGADSEKMRIQAGGNVGIGTASPNALLHLYSTSNTQLRLQTTGTGNGSNVIYQNGSASYTVGINSAEQFSFYSSQLGSDAGFINTNGNLYWNHNILLTTNAKFLYSRDTNGTLTRMLGMNSGNTTYIGPIDSYAGGSIVYGISSNVVDQVFYTSGSERLRIKATTGNVGIGTTSPGHKLQVSGGDIAIDVGERMYFGGGNHTYISEDADDRLRFFTGGAEFMRFTESTDNSLNIYEDVYVADDKKIHFGAGNDIKIYHNSSSGNANIENYTGDIYVTNYTDDGDIFFRVDDGGNNIITAMKIDASSTGTVRLPNDGQNLYLGAGDDLRLLHDGTNSYVYAYNGPLYVGAVSTDQDVFIRGNDGGTSINAVKFDMSDAGTALFNHDVRMLDNSRYFMGTSNDFQMMHDGTNSHIENLTGDLYITNHADDQDIIFRIDDGGSGASEIMRIDASSSHVGIGTASPAQKLHISGGNARIDGDIITQPTNKFYLDGGNDTYIYEAGANVIDFVTAGSRTMQMANTYAYTEDNVLLGVGGDVNFYMKHDGTNSLLQNSTGDLTIKTTASNEDMIFSVNDGGSQINAIYIDSSNNGMVKLQNDLQYLTFGSGDDGVLYSYEDNFYVSNHTAGKDTIFSNLNSDSSSYVEIMRLDGSTSRVGIGTASPATKLHINDSGANGIVLKASDNSSNSPRIFFDGTSTSSIFQEGNDLSFRTGATTGASSGTERMLINSSGNVGIGSASPSFKLKVNVDDGSYTNFNTIAGFQSKRSADTEYEVGIAINSGGDALTGSISSNVYFSGTSANKGNTGRSSAELRFSNSANNESEFAFRGQTYNSTTFVDYMKLDNTQSLHVDGDVVAYSTSVSDKRLKDNIRTIDNALDKVIALRGVEFDWNATSRSGQHDIGLIAQEVEEIIPEVVREKKLQTGEFTDNEKTFKTIDYDKMVGVLIEAIKEQQQQINELKEKLNG
jgi:hypothetical protein